MTPAGMIITQSAHDAPTTYQRLRAFVDANVPTVFTSIEHDSAAAAVALELPFTRVLIFGNPCAGTPLMQQVPSLAIDLPMRILVWEASDGVAWVAYNDPGWTGTRHGMLPGAASAFEAMQRSLEGAVKAATGAAA